MKHVDPALVARLTFLKRRFPAHSRIADLNIEAVHLADVVLLVLLFFMLSSSFVMQPGMVVDLPKATAVTGVPYTALVLTLTQEGMYFFNDERTTLEELPEAFARMAFERPDETLIIEADERVAHQRIVEVYNLALEASIAEVALAVQWPVKPVVQSASDENQ